ncbi:MAG: hypothetical protein HYY92_03855 [Parcubacteria group bacterium]|nr:hypothetical protein [Parcubacteria group bacterium]
MKQALCAITAAMLFVSVAAVSLAADADVNQDWRFELAETGKKRVAVTAELFTGGASSRTDTDADVDWHDFSGLAFTFAKGIPWWWSDAAPSVSIGQSFFSASGLTESNGSVDVIRGNDPAHQRIRAISGEFLEAGVEIPLFSSKVFRRKGDRWGQPWRPYFLVAYMDGKVGMTIQKGPDVPSAKADRSDISERTVRAHGMKYGFALSFSESLSFILSVRLIRAPLGIMRDISLTSVGFQANFY